MTNIQENPRKEEKPIKPVIIHACGELRMEDKLTEEQADFLPNYERNVYAEDEARAERKAERRRLIDAKMKADKDKIEKENGVPGDIFSKIYENAEKERAETPKEMSEED